MVSRERGRGRRRLYYREQLDRNEVKRLAADQSPKPSQTPKSARSVSKPADKEPITVDERFDAASERLRTLGIGQLGFRGSSTWGAAFRTKAEQADHMELIADELERLYRDYPNMPRGHTELLHVVDSKKGRATAPALAGPAATRELSIKGKEISEQVWDRGRNWERANGRPWTSYQQGSVRRDNLRHEVAHNLSDSDIIDEWRLLRRRGGYTKEWFRRHVSDYAGKDAFEALADTFTVVTRRDYRVGTLPADIEDFIRIRMLGG